MRVITKAEKAVQKARRLWSAMWKRLNKWGDGYERKHIARRAVVVLIASPFVLVEMGRQAYHVVADTVTELYQYIRHNH
ncbi:hypothetical protein ZPAH7B_orf00028 [Aeromonas phage ZPAH7B]|uniref:Uncharacterized protein n=2 Tax=Aerosvirus ZPAH7 TaxID=2733366 RepID=A0A3Q9GIY3_9CAUD|nr:hypothetical protein HOU89_gp28 [Aeromonas phage ZPAH7]AZQ96409.1 hypothetical protein ZPAH7_orf00028 [Aeromonas phage ZPAH7]QAX95989.1 hypothetical protein ZPAH7B_orf00028 [Aeromonas phage ZPAH7B]